MPNEVIIVVKARNDTKRVFDAIRQEARNLGDDLGSEITTATGQRLQREAANTSGAYARAGDVVGEAIGNRVADRINERVRRAVTESTRRASRSGAVGDGGDGGDGTYRDANGRLRDSRGRFIGGAGSGGMGGRGGDGGDAEIDRASILQRLGGLAGSIGERIRGGLTSAVTSFFSGDFISIMAKTLTVAGLVAVLAPTLGAALSAAVLTAFGGGVIGAGLYSAIANDPKLKEGFKELRERWKGIFKDFGRPFQQPAESILEDLNRVSDQAKPILDRIGKSMAPVADKLGAQGVTGFLQNLLPSLERFAKASEPLIETLADELPGIGEALADMFDSISSGSEGANEFWNDFLNALQIAIRTLGIIIGVLADLYSFARTVFIGLISVVLQVFDAILTGAEKAFGWIPNLGPKLSRAREQFTNFRARVNKELSSIDDVDVTVRIRQVFTTVGTAVGDVGRILSRRAHGGVIGQAAGGGARSGLTWVGEHGPELLDIGAGSKVHSNPDSMRMAQRGSGSGLGPILVQFVLDGRIMAERLLDPTREMIDRRFGGSVQAAYGRA